MQKGRMMKDCNATLVVAHPQMIEEIASPNDTYAANSLDISGCKGFIQLDWIFQDAVMT
jgi:hypothetical protein